MLFLFHSFLLLYACSRTYSQFLMYGLNSMKYFSNSLLSISYISIVWKPGVSKRYVSFSISYKVISVVVFFPLLFFLLISPSPASFFPSILFVMLDFPNSWLSVQVWLYYFLEFLLIYLFRVFSKVLVCITLYPTSV